MDKAVIVKLMALESIRGASAAFCKGCTQDVHKYFSMCKNTLAEMCKNTVPDHKTFDCTLLAPFTLLRR